MAKLVPCVCGREPRAVRGGGRCRIVCPHCGAAGEPAEDPEEAASRWNAMICAGYESEEENSVNEWISVEEKLPEIGETVLTAGYQAGTGRVTWTCREDEMEESITGEPVWRASMIQIVRYWMRLPELPDGQRIGARAILECPHCGAAAKLQHSEPENSQEETWSWRVQCSGCPAQTGWMETPEEAISAWNRRVSS